MLGLTGPSRIYRRTPILPRQVQHDSEAQASPQLERRSPQRPLLRFPVLNSELSSTCPYQKLNSCCADCS
jgi:hypothetical protein